MKYLTAAFITLAIVITINDFVDAYKDRTEAYKFVETQKTYYELVGFDVMESCLYNRDTMEITCEQK